MSLKIFCRTCGIPTLYTTTVPNFCSNCNKPFNSFIAAQTPKVEAKIQIPPGMKLVRDTDNYRTIPKEEKQYGQDEDGKYEIISSAPEIDGLDLEIDIPPRGQLLSELCPKFYQDVLNSKIKKKPGRPRKNS